VNQAVDCNTVRSSCERASVFAKALAGEIEMMLEAQECPGEETRVRADQAPISVADGEPVVVETAQEIISSDNVTEQITITNDVCLRPGSVEVIINPTSDYPRPEGASTWVSPKAEREIRKRLKESFEAGQLFSTELMKYGIDKLIVEYVGSTLQLI